MGPTNSSPSCIRKEKKESTETKTAKRNTHKKENEGATCGRRLWTEQERGPDHAKGQSSRRRGDDLRPVNGPRGIKDCPPSQRERLLPDQQGLGKVHSQGPRDTFG